jgi:hypothetical protein
MSKQSSVEWLFDQFVNGDMYNVEDAQRIKHQALKIHNQEIVEAYDYEAYDDEGNFLNGDEYYQETYGGKNE